MINKKNVAIVLAVGLILSIGCVVGQQHVLQAENCTFLNLTKFAAENPVYPELGYLSKQAVLGENASINLAQFTTGSHSGAQYHSASDEIDFIIQGQANLKAKGEVRPVKSGDLIYLPSGTVHDYEALGTEDLQILVVFSPPLDENDRHLV